MDRHFNFRNNFFRHYLTNYFLYDIKKIKTPTGEDPRKRYSPFLWLPGRQRWDLTRFNEEYFRRLFAMLWAAREHIIYVQLTLFDGAGLRFNERWSLNPWNAANNINEVVENNVSGMPMFYDRTLEAKDSNKNPTTLGAIQDGLIKRVLQTALEFGNVVFEIMNEPTSGSPEVRARWADQIVGTINGATKNRRLIFYNDHSYSDDASRIRGLDVNKWRELNLPNYGALDGVIFHGDPRVLDPDNIPSWKFRADKIIQASSDTADSELREQTAWNEDATNKCFRRLITYQAEAVKNTALQGISTATPPPSFITPMRALGAWELTSGASHFNIRFDANGRYLAFDPLNDLIINQGRLVDFDPDYFTVLPDGQREPVQYIFSVTSNGQNLTYRKTTPDDAPLVQFARFPLDLEPFLFGWEKIDENPQTNWAHLFLYFRKSGPAVSFAARDSQNPQNIITQGTVTSVTSYPPKIKLLSAAGETTYDYYFFNNGQKLRIVANNHRQDFKRHI
jgi:hypothetical protein